MSDNSRQAFPSPKMCPEIDLILYYYFSPWTDFQLAAKTNHKFIYQVQNDGFSALSEIVRAYLFAQ